MKTRMSFMNTGLRPRSMVTVAMTAVTRAGIAATSENSATTRLCSRAPARPARRAAMTLRASRPISTSSVRMMSALPAKIAITTVGVGITGVNPAKTMNVATARSRAAPTASGPKRPAAPPSSGRPALSGSCCVLVELTAGAIPPACAIANIAQRALQVCNDVAGLRQNGGGRGARFSAQRPNGPQIEIANLFAQGVAVESEHLRRLDLIAARRRQRGGDQRRLQFAQQPVIKTDRRRIVAERAEQ